MRTWHVDLRLAGGAKLAPFHWTGPAPGEDAALAEAESAMALAWSAMAGATGADPAIPKAWLRRDPAIAEAKNQPAESWRIGAKMHRLAGTPATVTAGAYSDHHGATQAALLALIRHATITQGLPTQGPGLYAWGHIYKTARHDDRTLSLEIESLTPGIRGLSFGREHQRAGLACMAAFCAATGEANLSAQWNATYAPPQSATLMATERHAASANGAAMLAPALSHLRAIGAGACADALLATLPQARAEAA